MDNDRQLHLYESTADGEIARRPVALEYSNHSPSTLLSDSNVLIFSVRASTIGGSQEPRVQFLIVVYKL